MSAKEAHFVTILSEIGEMIQAAEAGFPIEEQELIGHITFLEEQFRAKQVYIPGGVFTAAELMDRLSKPDIQEIIQLSSTLETLKKLRNSQ